MFLDGMVLQPCIVTYMGLDGMAYGTMYIVCIRYHDCILHSI